MGRRPMSEEEALMIARVLHWMWPHSWQRTPEGIWRCLIYTKIVVFGSLGVVLLLLAFLIVVG
jgi:hypothetical protein